MINSSNIKTRNYSIVTYDNPATIIDNLTNVLHCIAIYHNRDKNDDGSFVKPHYHLIVVLKNPRYYSSISKVLKELSAFSGENSYCEPCSSLPRFLLYIFHQDEKSLADVNKATYQFNEAYSDNDSWWHKVFDGSDDMLNVEFVQDLLVESPIKLAYKYGRDFIRNYHKYMDFREQLYSTYGGDFSFLTDDVKFDGASNVVAFKSSITYHFNNLED